MDWARMEGSAYWLCFIGVFFAVAIWESFRPHRELSLPPWLRWANHGILLVIAIALTNFLLRFSPVALAIAVSHNRFGVLNQSRLPLIARCVLAVLLLDLVEYGVHWSFHHLSWLWRIHRLHHSDPDYDIALAARFHPFEVLVSQGTNLALVALLSPPVEGVFFYEILSVALNLVAHANANLPARIEAAIAWLFVTPHLHRIHHSEELLEQQRNFGQTFSLWDRLFGTLAPVPIRPANGFKTGLKGIDNARTAPVIRMLLEPFQPEPPSREN